MAQSENATRRNQYKRYSRNPGTYSRDSEAARKSFAAFGGTPRLQGTPPKYTHRKNQSESNMSNKEANLCCFPYACNNPRK